MDSKTLLNNVTISKTKLEYDQDVVLNNGSLVLYFNPQSGLIGAYIVTSFRDNDNRYKGDSTSEYCSFVDLNTGLLRFVERCSRNTTIRRIMSHLRQGDYFAKEGIKEGYYIEVYDKGNYQVNLDLISKQF